MNSNVRLQRDRGFRQNSVFVIMPYGKREVRTAQGDPEIIDFDALYHDVLVPVIESVGLVATRADSLYEGDTVLENVWNGLQEGQLVIVDLSGSNRNVMLEFGWAYLLNKKIIPLTQSADDVPSDLPGLRYISYGTHFSSIDRMKTELLNRLEALRHEPPAELTLVPMATATIRPVPARVVSVSREHVVVEAEKGQFGVLGAADVDYTRIMTDMARRFHVGEVIDGAFETTDGYTRYTMLAGQTNPWREFTQEFAEGDVVTGKVVNVMDGVGAFVRVGHGLNGLVPSGALRDLPPVQIGTEITVGITRLNVPNRQIQLAPAGARPAGRPPAGKPVPERPKAGDRFDAEIIRAEAERDGRGGYALVRLPGYERPAMLHCTQMSAEVRADLNRGQLEIGELLMTEVIKVADNGKVFLRDLETEPPKGD
ncbi:S1 RNA-binding domain-containing protein [Catenuloplanes japonicus]|uniref:S1 RNA-binding domain-containing protein n=1 Tax=Catenuloplanes japonicus TaxID=33876 RepID=UPI000691F6B6|nr:S1 RNA-binding domain-containing protein [Catenuloplanes japonicus]